MKPAVRRRRRSLLAATGLYWACATASAPAAQSTPRLAEPAPPVAAPAPPLARADAERALDESRYAEAERIFRGLPASDLGVRLGLGRVLMLTGRHTEAQTWLRAGVNAGSDGEVAVTTLLAESSWQTGDASGAEAL